MVYPKILIINNYSFNDYGGGGITLKNLFLGWPKDKLAIAHFSESKPMTTVCESYFKIGYNECHYIFPFNKLSNEPRGRINGPYLAESYLDAYEGERNSVNQNHIPTKNVIKKKVLNFINDIGIREFIHPLKISKSLKEWILDFNPDIIYCQPENISFINLILKVKGLTSAKIVIHVMDDWPYLIYKNKTLKIVLRAIVKFRFQKLLTISSLRLGISKAMADEFQHRYKLPFKYFHNPIDITKLDDVKSITKTNTDSSLIVYSGRIGWTASHDSIIEFSKCIEELRKEGLNIHFNIYTDLNNSENDFSKFQRDGTTLFQALKDNNFLSKLLEADLLLYPVDFDRKSIEFIRLSFPTKLPSYLISGIPILCYGPSEVYSIKFMTENRLGFICNVSQPDVLKRTIKEALNQKVQREDYSTRAFTYAKTNFELSKVRSSFHQELANCVK